MGKGKYFAVNVPLKDGIQDDQYVDIFTRFAVDHLISPFSPRLQSEYGRQHRVLWETIGLRASVMKFSRLCRVMTEVRRVYKPSAVVCQCGADGLSDDPMASFNLTINGMSRCVQLLLGWNLPLLLVGGGERASMIRLHCSGLCRSGDSRITQLCVSCAGGYNIPNTAKCWTTLTALTLGETLPSDIPEHKVSTSVCFRHTVSRWSCSNKAMRTRFTITSCSCDSTSWSTGPITAWRCSRRRSATRTTSTTWTRSTEPLKVRYT